MLEPAHKGNMLEPAQGQHVGASTEATCWSQHRSNMLKPAQRQHARASTEATCWSQHRGNMIITKITQINNNGFQQYLDIIVDIGLTVGGWLSTGDWTVQTSDRISITHGCRVAGHWARYGRTTLREREREEREGGKKNLKNNNI